MNLGKNSPTKIGLSCITPLRQVVSIKNNNNNRTESSEKSLKSLSSETRVLKVKSMKRRDLKCNVDKITFMTEFVDLNKVRKLQVTSKTIAFHESLRKTKQWWNCYDLNQSCVLKFGDLELFIKYLRYYKAYQVVTNPSKCSYPFLVFVMETLNQTNDFSISRLEINLDVRASPSIVIGHINLLRKHNFKILEDRKGARTLYCGKEKYAKIYDNYGYCKKRIPETTRIEVKFSKPSRCPIKRFKDFGKLAKNKNLFSDFKMPQAFRNCHFTMQELRAAEMYMKEIFKVRCSVVAKQNAFQECPNLKTVLNRFFKKRITRYANLNKMFRANFNYYLNQPATDFEKKFISAFSSSTERKV